ncbi:ATP-dependent helicase [Methylobacter sp.]|uniref:ATP-dependent helicase n=1 Tax=Methylobacter sp. TaxID=2051955 RepID=UPI003DA5101C
MAAEQIDIRNIIHNKLTPEQAAAALDDCEAVLCIACAGSGKSETLAYRVARLLLDGANAEEIVVFTFTEKAADSIKKRIADVLVRTGQSVNLIGRMFIGTIHAFCQNVLAEADAQYRQFDVLDSNRFLLFLISRYPTLEIKPLRVRNKNKYYDTLHEVQNAWNMMCDEGLSFEDIESKDACLAQCLRLINEKMRGDQFIDFASMIRFVVNKSHSEPRVIHRLSKIKHLLVDEYQDVSGAQEDLISKIKALGSSIFVVGDDDQSIYGWRGALVHNILEFEQRYPNSARHTLDKNFRSTEAIVQISDGFARAELGAGRLMKAPHHAFNKEPRQIGVFFFSDRTNEAEWVSERIRALLGTTFVEKNGTQRGLTPADFAILMRSTKTAEQSGVPRHAAFSEALNRHGILFTLSAGGSAFERPLPRALREFFRLFTEDENPSRDRAQECFRTHFLPLFPHANMPRFLSVVQAWGRDIHRPISGASRIRLYPQQLLLDVLESLNIASTPLGSEDMRDLGLFSRILQDVEGVFLSVDSKDRFVSIVNYMDFVAEDGYDTTTEDVVARPDAVTISTVHQVKGLEFPVVFVVDVVQGRFPSRRRSYDAWIPEELVQNSIRHGAYVGTQEAEARLFYTALTRAERYLYVTGCEQLPGGKRKNKQSLFSARLQHQEIVKDETLIPQGLTSCEPRARVDEALLPTSFTEVKYYLRCPADYRFRKCYGFSPRVPELFGYGRVVHVAVEKLHEIFSDQAPTPDQAREIVEQNFHLKHIAPSRDPENRPGAYENAKLKAKTIAAEYVEKFADDFARRRQVEARFEINAEGCLITGSIDLLMHYSDEGKILDAHVIDFKTMEGGVDVMQNSKLEWTELALQVQLYAKAAREVLDEHAATGSIHLLKDNQRINVPIDDAAIDAAIKNVEWAVSGVLAQDFPMRPAVDKCSKCDFHQLCAQKMENFATDRGTPPEIYIAENKRLAVQAVRMD